MINVFSGLKGRFKLEKYRADAHGNPVVNTRQVVADWFDNIIVNNGLDRLGGSSINSVLGWVQVGAGSSIPDVNDSSLEARIGSTSVALSADDGASSVPPYNLYFRRQRRFSVGQAAGNLSEIGVGWGGGSDQLFSRALIVDSNNEPTTITILEDEILDVSYEFQIFPDLNDFIGEINIGGVAYDYVARASRVGAISSAGWGTSTSSGSSVKDFANVYSGSIGQVTGFPSGVSGSTVPGRSVPYVPGSLIGSSVVSWGVGSGNIGGVRSVALGVGWTYWQVEFSSKVDGSAIPKDENKELIFTISHSWARREE